MTPHWEMHQASLSGLKFACSEFSVTACDPEFQFLDAFRAYFFLSGGKNQHIIHYELGAETDVDFRGEKKILERQIWGFFH